MKPRLRALAQLARRTLFMATGTLACAAPALAQTSSPSPSPAPAPPPAAPPVKGDGAPFSGYTLSLPARMSLLANVTSLRFWYPQCDSREDAAGNSVGGVPLERYLGWRPLRGFFVSTFSRLGCPIDAGLGATLTYAIPLRESVSLGFSTGMFLAPGQLPVFGGLRNALSLGLAGAPSPAPTTARVDLVWRAPSGQPWSIGAESAGRRSQRVSFAGQF